MCVNIYIYIYIHNSRYTALVAAMLLTICQWLPKGPPRWPEHLLKCIPGVFCIEKSAHAFHPHLCSPNTVCAMFWSPTLCKNAIRWGINKNTEKWSSRKHLNVAHLAPNGAQGVPRGAQNASRNPMGVQHTCQKSSQMMKNAIVGLLHSSDITKTDKRLPTALT